MNVPFRPWAPSTRYVTPTWKEVDECTTHKERKIHLDALLLIGAFGLEVGLVLVGSLDAQEAVGGVADATGQHAVPQHGVHHRTLPIAGPGRENTLPVILQTQVHEVHSHTYVWKT